MHLIAHPDWPANAIDAVDVEVSFDNKVATLIYRVSGAIPTMAPQAAPERTDDLWQHTCFEMFVRPAGEAYYEFNFAPSTAWAAYRFERYRAGRIDQPLAPPVIAPIADGVRVTVDLSGLPKGSWRVGIAAVIEETDGTKSFWALAHPAGKPDFHHAEGFVLSV